MLLIDFFKGKKLDNNINFSNIKLLAQPFPPHYLSAFIFHIISENKSKTESKNDIKYFPLNQKQTSNPFRFERVDEGGQTALFRCVDCNKLWEFEQPEVHLCSCSREMNETQEMIRQQNKRELVLALSQQLGDLSEQFVDSVLQEIEELQSFANEGLNVDGLITQVWSKLNPTPQSIDWRTMIN